MDIRAQFLIAVFTHVTPAARRCAIQSYALPNLQVIHTKAQCQYPARNLMAEGLKRIIHPGGKYYESRHLDGPPWLMKACEHIRSPRHFDGGIKEFYRLCGKSAGHVARVVMNLWKKTPTDIVNHARLEYAAMKLAMGSDDILGICMESGFSSLAHFYKLFKELYGITPRQYRLIRQSLVINFDEKKINNP